MIQIMFNDILNFETSLNTFHNESRYIFKMVLIYCSEFTNCDCIDSIKANVNIEISKVSLQF